MFIEYVMLAGVNDRYEQALALAERCLDPPIYKVNLIPYNPTGSTYDGSSREAIDAFRDVLDARGFTATVRLTRGRDIDAACGQLAAKAPPARREASADGPGRSRRASPARSRRSRSSRLLLRRRIPLRRSRAAPRGVSSPKSFRNSGVVR